MGSRAIARQLNSIGASSSSKLRPHHPLPVVRLEPGTPPNVAARPAKSQGIPQKSSSNPGNGILPCCFFMAGGKSGGATAMPTAKEYRFEAKACLELAERTKEPYVKVVLIELAREYNRK